MNSGNRPSNGLNRSVNGQPSIAQVAPISTGSFGIKTQVHQTSSAKLKSFCCLLAGVMLSFSASPLHAADTPAGRLTLALPQTLLPPGQATVAFKGAQLKQKLPSSEILLLPAQPASSEGPALPQQSVRLEVWDGLSQSLQANATLYPPHWDALLANGPQTSLACAHSWLQPLEGEGKCGLPAGMLPVVLAWDTTRLPLAPSWADLWDVVRLPGQRSLPQTARGTLEVALLADGVAPSDVYHVLSTPAGIDRAFWRLDQLRPYIVWWRTPLEARHLMERGAILMGLTPITALPPSEETSHKIPVFMHHSGSHASPGNSFAVSPDTMMYSPQFWSIPATATETRTNQTLAFLHDRHPQLPPAPPTALSRSDLLLSDSFWNTHGQVLEQRFQSWVNQTPPR